MQPWLPKPLLHFRIDTAYVLCRRRFWAPDSIYKSEAGRFYLFGYDNDLYSAMTKDENFLTLIDKGFPEEPLPARFFWSECKDPLDHDIPDELSSRIGHRSWKNITILDWRMIGASPAIARFYMEPGTFLYYLPSLLVNTLQDVEYIDFSLESIIPYNKERVPRGKWWNGFFEIVSPTQRATFSAFLSCVRFLLWDKIGLANQNLVHDAERIWPGPNGPLS